MKRFWPLRIRPMELVVFILVVLLIVVGAVLLR